MKSEKGKSDMIKQLNGFRKEQVKTLKWNEKLGFLWDNALPNECVDQMINVGMLETLEGIY